MHDLETARRIEVADDIARRKKVYDEVRAEFAKAELKTRRGETETSQDIARLKKEYAAVKAELANTKSDLASWEKAYEAYSFLNNTRAKNIDAEYELNRTRSELIETKNTLEWLRKEHANMSDEVRRLRNNPPRYPTWPAQDFYAQY